MYRFVDWYTGLLQVDLWGLPYNEAEEFRVLQREFNSEMAMRKLREGRK